MTGIVAEVDQALIDDLRPGLGGNIASEIDVEFTGDLEVIGGPGITLRVEQIHAAAATNGDEWIGLGGLPIEFRRFQVHPRQMPYDFQMTELLGSDVHEQVLAIRILAIEALDRILHGSGQLAIRAAELLEQHVSEARIGLSTRTVNISFLTW